MSNPNTVDFLKPPKGYEVFVGFQSKRLLWVSKKQSSDLAVQTAELPYGRDKDIDLSEAGERGLNVDRRWLALNSSEVKSLLKVLGSAEMMLKESGANPDLVTDIALVRRRLLEAQFEGPVLSDVDLKAEPEIGMAGESKVDKFIYWFLGVFLGKHVVEKLKECTLRR